MNNVVDFKKTRVKEEKSDISKISALDVISVLDGIQDKIEGLAIVFTLNGSSDLHISSNIGFDHIRDFINDIEKNRLI